MSNQYVTTVPKAQALGVSINVVATVFVDEEARQTQAYAFDLCHNPGDSFLVQFKKVSCKYERRYWQGKLTNAKQYWQEQQECTYTTRSIPDMGVLVTRLADDNPHRRMQCQL